MSSHDAKQRRERVRAVLLLLVLALVPVAGGARAQPQVGGSDPGPEKAAGEIDSQDLAEPPPPEPITRRTISPWIVDVYGRNYDSFTNEGASRVISDWLTNALIDLDLFNIVNRERIRAVLSERNLAISGMARDVSSHVPENELATAGRLLSVNYILLGNVKNLGATSEIDFKLLDVQTTTYSKEFRLNFEIPFNPQIERFKAVVDRIVGELAASFPVVAGIREITFDGHFKLWAGSENGLAVGLTAELWRRDGVSPVATGMIVQAETGNAEMVLDEPYPHANVWDYVAKISIAPGAESLLNNSRLEMERGNFEEARKILAAGIEAYPGHASILALHARTCWRLQDYEGAVSSYRAALKAEPNDIELLEEAAGVLFEGGHFQEVVEVINATGQRSLRLELRLGDALAAQDYPRLAREAYKRAFRIEPENPEPHVRLAVLAARSGELSEIQRELRLAREGAPEALTIQLADVVLPWLDGGSPDIDGARDWFQRAVAAGDFQALATASELALFRPELWEVALELARLSVEINPAYLHGQRLMADAYVFGERVEEAIAVLEKALAAHPNNVALLVRSGELLSQVGEDRKAELRLLHAMDLAPLAWRPADALGDSHFRQEAYLEAVDAYQTALQVAERAGAPDLTPRLQKLGRAAVLGNQHATAQPYLERCVERSPDNKECRYYLGLCYFVSRLEQSDDQAIVNLRAAEGFSADAYHYLGALYDRREEFTTARDWYQRCVDEGCSLLADSEQRIDEIERIRGHITSNARGDKRVNLDLGRIHGVQPSQIAVVLNSGDVIARLRTEEVQEKVSVAKILGGKPLPGHAVVFRPARPRGLTARKAVKRGVQLRWRPNIDPELSHYMVYRRDGGNGDWQPKKRVTGNRFDFIDKSAKPGNTYSYKVTAVNRNKLESLASRPCDISLEE